MPSIYLDDFHPGAVREAGPCAVTREEIIDFATRYDPQPFHVDEDAARETMFGGLISSGWMTIGIAMRLYVDSFLHEAASLGSPGVDQIRWVQPVRPGDTLRLRTTVREVKPSQSKPDRGIVFTHWEVLNQKDEVVLTMEGMGMFRRRPAAGA